MNGVESRNEDWVARLMDAIWIRDFYLGKRKGKGNFWGREEFRRILFQVR